MIYAYASLGVNELKCDTIDTLIDEYNRHNFVSNRKTLSHLFEGFVSSISILLHEGAVLCSSDRYCAPPPPPPPHTHTHTSNAIKQVCYACRILNTCHLRGPTINSSIPNRHGSKLKCEFFKLILRSDILSISCEIGLGLCRQVSDVDPDLWRHMTSLGHNELKCN